MAKPTTDKPTTLIITNELRQLWTQDPVKWVLDVVKPPQTDRCPMGISYQQLDVLEGYRQLVTARIHRKAVLERVPNTPPLTPEEDILCAKLGISIQSGKGTGKDAVGSWIMLHFLDCMVAPNIKIMTTAPTEEQLKNNLWAEMFKWINRSDYLKETYTHSSEKVYKNEYKGKAVFATWKTCARSADPDDQAATMAGKHEDYMLLYVTEASAVPDPVFRPLESTMTGFVNIAIINFNPTRSKGYAIQSQTTDRKYWLAYQWDAEQSEIVDSAHVKRFEEKYGRDSNMFRINIRGLPPHSDFDTLIPFDWVTNAVNAQIEPDEEDLMVAGLDVAGGGSNSNVLVIGRGGVVEHIFVTNLMRKREIAEWVLDYWHQYGIETIAVDVNGLGSGVAEMLEDFGCDVRNVNVGREAEKSPHKYERLRDEIWMEAREAFEYERVSIPNHEELIGELTSIKCEMYKGAAAKMKVESKREMRARGLKSPDTADGFCLWLYATNKRGRKTRQSAWRLKKNRRFQERRTWQTV